MVSNANINIISATFCGIVLHAEQHSCGKKQTNSAAIRTLAIDFPNVKSIYHPINFTALHFPYLIFLCTFYFGFCYLLYYFLSVPANTATGSKPFYHIILIPAICSPISALFRKKHNPVILFLQCTNGLLLILPVKRQKNTGSDMMIVVGYFFIVMK